MSDFAQPHGLKPARPPCPSSSPRVSQVHVHCISEAIQPSYSLMPSSPSDFNFPSIRWPKYWSFTFSISPSNEYLGLISFKIGWFDLPAVSGTFKSLLQDFSLKASILQHAAFFMFPFSQPYMTTEKTIALTMRTFVGKAMSLLFDTLSRFDLAFLPRSNHLLISWLQSPSSVISGAPKEKICHCFQFSPFHLPWVGLDASIFFLFF